MLLEFDVERFVEPDIHEMDRGTALLDHAEVVRVGRVIEAPQLPVVNAESVLPEVQGPLLDLFRLGRVTTGSARRWSVRVGDDTARSVVAT